MLNLQNSIFTLFILAISHLSTQAQSPILELTFDNTLLGTNGETPISSTGGITFTDGIRGAAAIFDLDAQVIFESLGNIDSQVGTLDFVVVPNWNGNDSQTHEFLIWDSLPSDDGGGLVFSKDGANNLRHFYNRFSQGGQSEIGTSINVSDWIAFDPHYVAYSWNAIDRRLFQYVDGVRVREFDFPDGFVLPTVTRPDFLIGNNLDAALDELRIFDRELSETEISNRFNELFAVPEPSSTLILGIVLAATLLQRRKPGPLKL